MKEKIEKKIATFFIIVICLLALALIITYLVKVYKNEAFGLSPGTLTQPTPSTWYFVPTTGYYGNVTITYQLTDGSISAPVSDTATFSIIKTYGPVTYSNTNATLAPATSTTANFVFSVNDILSMLIPSGSSPFGIMNLTTSAVNLDTNTVMTNFGTLTDSSNAAIVPNKEYLANSSFIFTPSTNIGNVQVTINFQLVDSNYGQTVAPGLAQLVTGTNASIKFLIPYIYQAPVAIPVTLTGPYYQGLPITITSSQLIGTSVGDVRYPTLTATNVNITPLTINTSANSNQVLLSNTPIAFNSTNANINNYLLSYNNGYFTITTTNSYTVNYTVNITNYASNTITIALVDNTGKKYLQTSWSPSNYSKISGFFQSGGSSSGNPGTGSSGCISSCNSTPGCVGFSYSQSGSDTSCYIKTDLSGNFGNGNYSAGNGYDTYVGQYQNIPGFSSGNGLAIATNPLPSIGATGCNALCSANKDCVGFSYTTNGTDTGNCYLKSDLSNLNGTGNYSSWTNTTTLQLSSSGVLNIQAGTVLSLQLSRACTVVSGSISFS